MRTRIRPRFAQLIAKAISEYLAGRPLGRCLDGDGDVSQIGLAIRDGIGDLAVPLLFHRLPDVGGYSAIELVDEEEIEALVLFEFSQETTWGVNLLNVSGEGGLVLHFDWRRADTNEGRVSLVAWGGLEPLLERMEGVLSNKSRFEEVK